MANAVTSDTQLTLEGLELKRGVRSRRRIPVLELPDGSRVEIPVTAIRGVQPGPVLYLGAGVHGDEVNGVEIVARLTRELDPGELRGTILAVPVQNPTAFQIQHRFPVGHLLKSPMDQNPADVFSSFPGDPEGNMAALIAHTLFEQLMRPADYMLDIHTPTTGGRYAPFAFLPPPRCGAVVQEAEALARAFGADFILANDRGMYVGDKNPHVVCAEHGRVAFGIELGEGGRLEPTEVERGIRGLRNLLRAVSMIPGETEEFGRRVVIRTMTIVRARRGGILHQRAALGTDVVAGEVIAEVRDVFGDVLEEVRAPHAGPIVRIATFPIVSTGERVAQLGVLR